jgi:polyhydroxybutyrate depolymerase
MRKVVGLAIAIVVALGLTAFACLRAVDASEAPAPAGSLHVPTSTKTYSLAVAGRERSYQVTAPDDGQVPSTPIIVMLSGLGATVSQEASRDRLVNYASADEAEIIYPVAFGESWNAGGCCGKAYAAQVDDVAFLKALVATVDPGHRRPIDVVGYSNGARLAYRIACTDPGLFDAYAMVKGEPPANCPVGKPATILVAASANDPEVPYQPGDHGSVESLPMTTLVSRLRGADKCTAGSRVTRSVSMTLTTWSGCGDGARLGFAVWKGGVHSFPRPPASVPAAAQVIWAFFTKTAIAPLPRA